ncbi:hypothetical protein [Sphingomonas guangdongensis]|uniref:hypothetical protein n=1 Tax=Sphingomonas guangdongensis TaxID=1141890 RepID=UPI000BE3F25F|nr:hypothetical protein [Sphingomonas guangdongensis]
MLAATVAYPQPALKRLVAVHQSRQTDDFLAYAWWTRWRRKAARQDFVMIGVTHEVAAPVGIAQRPPSPPRPVGLRHAAGRVYDVLRPDHRKVSEQEDRPRLVVETAPDAQGMLLGSIHVMPHQREEANAAVQKDVLRRLREAIRILPYEATTSALDDFPDQAAGLAARLNRPARIEFALFRTGEARLWFDEEATTGFDADQLEVLARQSYFFLKDMVHHHVHHDAKSDQITPLVPLSSRPLDDREEHWRRATAWSLTRIVDALARRGNLQDLREATGILAYADAFQSTLLKYRRRVDDPWAFEANALTYGYDYKHVRESLKVQLDQASARRANLGQVVVAGLAGCIAATSLLASTISAHNALVRNEVKPSGLVAIIPGLPDEWLTVAARWYLLPALLCACFLIIVSWQVLAEDRIGAKRVRPRREEQAIRGVVNSLALRFRWSARTVQRTLRCVYAGAVIGCVAATIWLAPVVLAAADAVLAFNPGASLGALIAWIETLGC